MSDEKPSQWRVCASDEGSPRGVRVFEDADTLICRVERMKHAALIADAPAMLELLRQARERVLALYTEMRDEFGSMGDDPSLWDDGELAKRIGQLLDKHGSG